jgi:hypothetical protein
MFFTTSLSKSVLVKRIRDAGEKKRVRTQRGRWRIRLVTAQVPNNPLILDHGATRQRADSITYITSNGLTEARPKTAFSQGWALALKPKCQVANLSRVCVNQCAIETSFELTNRSGADAQKQIFGWRGTMPSFICMGQN